MDAGPDRVLDVRPTARGEDSSADEIVEGRLQMVQRCRLVGFLTRTIVGGRRERGVEEAWFGSRELQVGLANRPEAESGAGRRVWPGAHLAHASGHAARELSPRT
jgi:hypothetical protein